VLSGIINKVTNNNSSQVYILDKQNKPTETDISMTFYDAYNQNLKYNLYQTLDERGQPDTLIIDPITHYNITFHTLPAIEKKEVAINADKHTIIEVNAPQGFIDFSHQGVLPRQELAEKIKCVIRSEKKIINVQSLNSKEKYLAGNYDIEILTLPRIIMNKTKVEGNSTTKIEIVSPGMLNLQKRFEVTGGIFIEEENRVLQKIYDLGSGVFTETIALQPGKYFVVYRMKNSKTMHNTKTLSFEIKSGDSVNLSLQ
jgi:Ca-activated chloride channel family protein